MKTNQDSAAKTQTNTDPGFKVPTGAADANTMKAANAAADASAPASAAAATVASASGIEVAPVQGAPETDTSSRDQLFGGGIFIVLLVVFFFARNAYTHHLVRRRVAPSAAGTAGWLLFVGLAFLSGATVLAIMNSAKFMNVAVMVPLLLFGVLALVGALLTGRREIHAANFFERSSWQNSPTPVRKKRPSSKSICGRHCSSAPAAPAWK